MRKQLYLDIQTALEAIVDQDNNPVFLHFDLWNQNVQFLEEDTPFQLPAIFVEFMPIEWKTIGNRVQEAAVVIKLHIVTAWYGQTAHYSPLQDEALNYLDIPDKVLNALQNLTVNGSASLTRTASVINHNHQRYVDSVEEYTAYIRDTSAVVAPESITRPAIKIATN